MKSLEDFRWNPALKGFRSLDTRDVVNPGATLDDE